MVECREDFSFPLEPSEALDVARHRLGKHLDGDLALQVRVRRTIDLAHTPGPKWAENFVGAKARADWQRQWLSLGQIIGRQTRAKRENAEGSDPLHRSGLHHGK
jgi:hypothetical protein